MQDRIVVQNQGMRAVALELGIEVACDFADIFAVKDYDFALGDPQHAEPLPPTVEPHLRRAQQPVRARGRDGVPAKTQVILSRVGEVDGCGVAYRLELEPRERWDLRLDIVPLLDDPQVVPVWPSGGSATSSRGFGSRSPPGSCASRNCARPGTISRTRSAAPCPTWRPSGCTAARTASASSPRLACRGS